MSERKLATVQRIKNIRPIQDADYTDLANVLGWQVVVRKNEFNEGDLCVYFEVDSVLPTDKPEFEFMRKRGFRIKTIKLRGVISQGLCLPLNILPKGTKVKIGDDVTDLLHVKKYEAPTERAERMYQENVARIHKNRVISFFMRYNLIRKLFLKNNKFERGFPAFIRKTDEVRLQSAPELLDKLVGRTDISYTEKLDGQSATYFVVRNPKKKYFWQIGVPKYLFGVCSRTVYRKTEDDSSWWMMARKYDIKSKLLHEIKLRQCDLIYIQGEIVGPGIQKNPYNLARTDLFLFNLFYNGRFWPTTHLFHWACENGFKTVPSLGINKDLEYFGHTVEGFVNIAQGTTLLAASTKKTNREGIVVRSGDISFKVINPEYLLALEDDDGTPNGATTGNQAA